MGEWGRTRGKQGSDWNRTGGRTGGGGQGIGLGIGLEVRLGVRLEGSDWGQTTWLVKFPKFHFDLLTCHPTWTLFIQHILVWVK